MLVSGPPGCGKATAVRVLAADGGWGVEEWAAPAPTLWGELAYARAGGGGGGAAGGWDGATAGAPYASKLDAFERWVGDASRYGGLDLAAAGGAARVGAAPAAAARPPPPSPSPPRRRLLLIRDLPHAAGPPQRAALAACLARLASPSSRFPAILVTTTSKGAERAGGGRGGGGGGGGGADAAAGLHGGLHRSLTDAATGGGAVALAFNPITAAGVVKALQATAAAAGSTLDAGTAAAVAAAAGGDLRTALLAAGLAARGAAWAAAAAAAGPPAAPPPAKRARGGGGRAGRAAPPPAGPAVPPTAAALAGRDAGLDGLAALGKVLHSKRDRGGAASAPPPPPPPSSLPTARPPLARPPPTSIALDAVESLADRAGLDGPGVGAWLFENVPPFFVGAVGPSSSGAPPTAPAAPTPTAAVAEEAAVIADYLSWTDAALQTARAAGGGAPPDRVSDALAASVALRGVLWARGARAAPPGWVPLRAPLAWAIARAATANRARLGEAIARATGAPVGSASQAATATLPALRSLARAAPACYGAALPVAWSRVWEGTVHEEVNVAAAAAASAAAAAAAAQAAAGEGFGGGGDGGEEAEDDPIEED